VQFYNKSEGNIISAKWYFQGGDPETSERLDPLPVTYYNAGEYDVKLVVYSANGTDSLIRKSYIRVLPSLSPNPSLNYFKIVFGNKIPEDLNVKVFDMEGRNINFFLSKINESSLKLDLSTHPSGIYFVRITSQNNVKVLKAILAR